MSKKRKLDDPFFEREKQKYGKPIPSREFILQFLQENGRPMSGAKLARALGLTIADEHEALRRRLQAMQRDGQLMQNRRGNYCLIDKLDLIAGHVQAHPDGYGFVIPYDGSEDLYLNNRQMHGILDGDHVLVREIPGTRARRREAVVVEVCERVIHRLVGRLQQEAGVSYVIPDNKRISQDILVASHELAGASSGQIVVLELLPQTALHSELIGKVVEILGEHRAPGMEIDIAIRSYELPYEWPAAVLKEIAQLHEQVREEELKDRTDLRHLPFVTIDGEDAKDFDDAVFCMKRPRGDWVLYVAIADVSHYVFPNTALDEEALLRGNSVYFPGRVIPMLPEILSNGLCSLKQKVDRLAMVCEVEINHEGELGKYHFYEAVIHSRARLTYTQVAAVLSGDQTTVNELNELVSHLQNLHTLFQIMHSAREKRGAIDFDTIETQIIFDKQKKIRRIVPLVRNDAHRLIEECMLMANVSAARFLEHHKISGLFRVHVPPVTSKIADLREFLTEFGLHLRGGEAPEPQHYAALLRQVKNRPDANLIQTVLLRSLTQAIYSPKNEGHFGLAYPAYAHFTSPIRRYPDLLVHRAIRHIIKNKKASGFMYDEITMNKFGEACSATERRADDATRDVIDWLKCEYMLEHVGEEFVGTISGVTAFGLFVTLKDVFVEGLVHVTALKNDYYHFDPLRHRLRGERTHTTYRLGDPIYIRIANVNLDDRKIDFELAQSH